MPQILQVAHFLAWCRVNTAFEAVPLSDEKKAHFRTCIEYVLDTSVTLGLKAAEKKAQRILDGMESLTVKDLFQDVVDLESRIDDEVEGIVFIHLSSAQYKQYHPDVPLFGDDVFLAFPSAINEIEEAGKCLALERATACVFHLMRTMEVALRVLAKTLEIPYAPSWESYLDQIGKTIETKWPKRTPKQKREHAFYSEAHAHLSSLKIAWRNPTMHIHKSYNLEQAEEVFNSVRVFMRHLATKLKEGKK